MKKIVLIAVAVVVKIFATMILGLIFTRDFTSYTSYVSRTNDISVGFLLFILSIDLFTIVILTNITNVFFKVSNKIRTYILFSIFAVLMFWLSDVLFIVEIKKASNWILTGMLLLDKYVIFLLISISYALKIHDLDKGEHSKTFLDYQQFKFKSIISEKLFSYSRIFYQKGVAITIYFVLMFYVNFLSLFLYSNSILFFLNVFVCGAILLYLSLIAFHQLDIIFRAYQSYASKQTAAPYSVSNSEL
jgi:hypothetical protein